MNDYEPWIVVVDEDMPAGTRLLVTPWLEDGAVQMLSVAPKQPGRNTWGVPYDCERAP